jgi:ankyrin repeat protein
VQNNYGDTPLHTAIAQGANRAAKLLLLSGASVHMQNLSGNSPIHTAVLHKNIEAVKTLIPFGADIEVRDNTGLTPLLLAAKYNHNEIARELIACGADPHARDNRGNTPLHESVKNRNEFISNLLIHSGADIYAKNRFNESPLTVALSYGKDVLQWFLTKRTISARNDAGNTPLHTAVQEGSSEDIIAYLLEKGADINSRNNRIETPLHLALTASHKQATQTLTEAGADIFLRNGEGESPLTLAMDMGREVFSWIVDARNVHAQDRNGSTALHLAVSENHPEIVQYLLTIGADPNRENNLGQTAAGTAQAMHHEAISRLFE